MAMSSLTLKIRWKENTNVITSVVFVSVFPFVSFRFHSNWQGGAVTKKSRVLELRSWNCSLWYCRNI